MLVFWKIWVRTEWIIPTGNLWFFNPFHAVSLQHSLKKTKKTTGVLRSQGYRNGTLAWNGIILNKTLDIPPPSRTFDIRSNVGNFSKTTDISVQRPAAIISDSDSDSKNKTEHDLHHEIGTSRICLPFRLWEITN